MAKRIFSIRPALSFRGRRFKGLRGWAGKPLHPPLTDFPIAAYAFAALFDLISLFAGRGSAVARDFFVSATHVIIIGAVGGLAASLTGFWDWWKGIERSRGGLVGRAKRTQVWRTTNWHMAVMLVVTALVALNIALRLGRFEQGYTDGLIAGLSLAAAALVSFGAMYGGALVYDHQFNVESLEGSTAWDETERDQLPADKPPSEW